VRITYDPEADALYITLKGHGVDHTVRIGPDLALDYGPDGELHGIEILAARHHLNLSGTRPEILLDNLNPVPAK